MPDEKNSKALKAQRVKRVSADLTLYPGCLNIDSSHVSIGDLHGNAIKLIYILIEEGVLKLALEQYITLYTIYTKPVENLTKEDCALFVSVLENVEITHNKALTIIGDELADRGNNDYFTLLVLKKLHLAQVDFDIILSNHGVEFIADFSREQFTGKARLVEGQARSLTNMYQLIQRGIIEENEIRNMVAKAYQPHMKAIGYTIARDGTLTLFTHAPVGLETIKELTTKLNQLGALPFIDYKDSSIKELMKTIDQINSATSDLWIKRGLAQEIRSERPRGFSPSKPITPSAPFYRLVWNRALGNELMIKPKGLFHVQFVHGYIGEGFISRNGIKATSHENLDTNFGREDRVKTGRDITHFTRHSSDFRAKQLVQEQEKIGILLSSVSAELKEACKEFNAFYWELYLKIKELRCKQEKNLAYKEVGKRAAELAKEIKTAGAQFFSQASTEASLKVFDKALQDAIVKADNEFKNHRSTWYTLHPILRGFLGILASLTVIIPLALMTTQQGYWYTFYAIPPTESKKTLDLFKTGMQELKSGITVSEEEEVEFKWGWF